MSQVGKTVLASDINSIFQRLETLRSEHYNGAGQTSAGQTALQETFTTQPVEQGVKAEEPYTLMKQYLNTLRQSVFLSAITEDQVNEIVIPTAGSLIEFANYEVSDSLITTIEGLPYEESTNFSGYNPNSSFHSGFLGASHTFGTFFSNVFGLDHLFGTFFSNFDPNATFNSGFNPNTSNFSGHQSAPYSCFHEYRDGSNFSGFLSSGIGPCRSF